MAYKVIRPDDVQWEDRPANERATERAAADITTAGALTQSRARLWKLPPGAHGTRHLEREQEEVFVVLSGTLTLMLGEPPERVEVPTGGIATVETNTPLQQRNEGDVDVVLFAYGAPPVTGAAEYLDSIDT
jgi:mannose-6-phosphate isomerase-like protein (cupin superfamily)